MPSVDMSVAELYQYTGTNPKPADFDAYWDEGLSQMHATKADVVFVPASFTPSNAQCFDLFFTGVGGARIHAKYLRPIHSPAPHPAILLFHGYTVNSGEWNDKLKYVNMGFSVLAMDCRGQAGLSEDNSIVSGNTLNGHIIRGLLGDNPEDFLYRRIFLDAAQLAYIAMDLDEVDAAKVGAFGGSQGGALTLACAALCPSIARLAPLSPFLCDYLRVWDMGLAHGPYEELTRFFRDFDPQHQNKDMYFLKLGYIDVSHLASRIKGRVLMGTGLMDAACPPSSQFAAYNRITAPKEIMLYPDYGHEAYPGYEDAVYMFMAEMLSSL